MKALWFGYECTACWKVVLDVRIACDKGTPAPEVKCPACGASMSFMASWEADEGGYGSRGDGGQWKR